MEYYGSPVSLKSIAQISTPDGSSLLLQPYDKSRYMTDEFSVQDFSRLLSLGRFMIHPNTFSLKAIEKAIVNSDLGVTPNNDGDVIRLSLPPLTSERRKVSLPGKPIHYSHQIWIFNMLPYLFLILPLQELSKVVAKQSEEGKVSSNVCLLLIV